MVVRAGLDLSGTLPNPFAPSGTTPNTFAPAGLSSTPLLDSSVAGGMTLEQALAAMGGDIEETGPRVLINPKTDKMFVNGLTYDIADYQSALDAEAKGALDAPRAAPPEGEGWEYLSPDKYKNYMRNIKDPSLGRLALKNLKIGYDNLGLLTGRARQWLGFEEGGQKQVDANLRELYYNQPFQREFTKIDYFENEGGNGAIDWFVATLAQQGPNLLESVLVALGGAIVGGATTFNPFGAAGGAILALMGKTAVKKSALNAAKKYAKGEALTNGERKLLREWAALTGRATQVKPNTIVTAGQARKLKSEDLQAAFSAIKQGRRQQQIGGAAIFSGGMNLFRGVGDIYGEMLEEGTGDRATAAALAVPYAFLETLPEFILAGRFFRTPTSRKMGKGLENVESISNKLTRGGKLSRGVKGFGVGAVMEGLTEAGQEALIMAGAGNITDAEAIPRFINSFAAGAAIGGTIGGIGNVVAGQGPIDILNQQGVEPPDKPAPQKGGPIAPAPPPPLDGDILGPEGQPPPVALPPPPSGTAPPALADQRVPPLYMDPQLEGPDVAPRASARPEPEPIVTPPPGPKVSPEAENLFNQAEQNARNQLPPPPANRELIAPAIDQLDPNNQLIQKQNKLLDLQIAREERAKIKDQREDAERQAREEARIAEIQNLRPEFVVGPTVNPAQNRMLEIAPVPPPPLDGDSVLDYTRTQGKFGNREPYSDQEIEEIIRDSNLSLANAARLREINKINRTRSQAEQGSKEALNEYKNIIFESGELTRQLNAIGDKLFETVGYSSVDFFLFKQAVIERLTLAWEGSETLAEVEALIGQYGIDGSIGLIQKTANAVVTKDLRMPDVTNEERQLVSLLASRPVTMQAASSRRQGLLDEAARLFPENESLEEFSDAELARLINDELSGGRRVRVDTRGTIQTQDGKPRVDSRRIVPDLQALGKPRRDEIASAQASRLAGRPINITRQQYVTTDRRGKANEQRDESTNVEEQSARALAQGEQAERLRALGGQSARGDTTTGENRLKAIIGEEKIGQGELQTTEQIKAERENLSKQTKKSEAKLEEIASALLGAPVRGQELRQAAPITLAQDQRFFDEIPEGATPSSLWKSYSVPDSPVVYERTNLTTQPDLIQVPQSIRARWETAIDNNQVNQAVFRELYLDAIGELTRVEYKENPAGTLNEQQEFFVYTSEFFAELNPYSARAKLLAQNIVRMAFFPTRVQDKTQDKTPIFQSKLISQDGNVTPQQKRVLNEAFVNAANEQTREGTQLIEENVEFDSLLDAETYREDNVIGAAESRQDSDEKYRIYKILPWVNYAIKNNITQDVTNIKLDSMPIGYKTAQSAAEKAILARVEAGEITAEVGADEYFKKLRSFVKKDVMTGINLAQAQEYYNQLAGISGRQELVKRGEEIKQHNSRLLADRITALTSLGNFRGAEVYDPVVGITTTKPGEMHYQTSMNEIRYLEYLYANSNKNYQAQVTDGKNFSVNYPLSAFFDKDGRLKLIEVYMRGTKGTSATVLMPDAQGKAGSVEREVVDKDATEAQIDAAKDIQGRSAFYARLDKEKPETPLNRVKILSTIKKFIQKIKAKDFSKNSIVVVKDQEELKRKYPNLFNQIDAARRAEGNEDFETLQLSGVSFGDKVVIFSDYIRDEKHLNFVLAHEILGHFGFRAFAGADRLNTILEEIYNTDSTIRGRADEYMNTKGVSKLEAIEEVMAEHAAALDQSIIRRIALVIQNVIEALGLKELPVVGLLPKLVDKLAAKFSGVNEGMTRYLLSRSRANVRRSGYGLVSQQQMLKNIAELSEDTENARFRLEQGVDSLASTYFSMESANLGSVNFNGVGDFITQQGKNLRNAEFRKMWTVTKEALQTLDFKARRSEGLSRLFKIFQMQAGKTRRFLSTYAAMTPLTHKPNVFGYGGPTELEREQAGELLAWAHGYLARSRSESDINRLKNFIPDANTGDLRFDKDAIDAAIELGTISIEQFREGLTVNNITKKWDIDENSNVWKLYLENRKAVNQAAIDLLSAQLTAAVKRKADVVENFKSIIERTGVSVTAGDIAIIERIQEEYARLYNKNMEEGSADAKSIENAEKFIREINRALHEQAKVNDFEVGNTPYIDGRYSKIIEGLRRLNTLVSGGVSDKASRKRAFKITDAITNAYILEQDAVRAQFQAKRTIANAYAPLIRRGDWTIRYQAIDAATGNKVSVDESVEQYIPFMKTDGETSAKRIQADLQATVEIPDPNNPDDPSKAKPILYEVPDPNNPKETMQVRFTVVIEKSRQDAPLSSAMNLGDFMKLATKFGLSINPRQRERISNAMRGVSGRRNSGYYLDFNPGWDKDMLRGVAEHLEMHAHMSAKAEYRDQIMEIMDNDDFWKGDEKQLTDLENAMNATGLTAAQREDAERRYNEYAYKYNFMAGQGKDIKKAKFINRKTGKREEVENLGRGEDFRQEALKLLAYYGKTDNILDNTEDILSKGIGGKLKLTTVVLQLGGSLAAAGINTVSMVSHSIPFLATYNPTKSFGGGFGFSASSSEMYRALVNLKNEKLADFEYVKSLIDNKNFSKHNLELDEVNALFQATATGVLSAAQFNALVGTARGGIKSNATQEGIKQWMRLFSYTEQLNRRTTFLAAYRLQRERLIALDPNFGNLTGEAREKALQEISDKAADFATDAVNTSQGEYSMYNRPEMARGDILQYLFMYKQFVIISVELLSGMNYRGKIAMLGTLYLMAGVKGFPFAEDIMDLIDTLLQYFGIKMPPVELWATELLDSIIPEAMQQGIAGGRIRYGPHQVMSGMLDSLTGGTFSTRLGFGDLVPLTGMFKYKSSSGDYWREAENFFGPMWSGTTGLFNTTASLSAWGLSKVGIKDEGKSLLQIAREFPSSGIRGVFNGIAYTKDGKITKADGTVIAQDAGFFETLLSFGAVHASRATEQNNIIRMAKDNTAYAQSFKARYKQRYVIAKMDKNRKEMRAILKEVRDFNRKVKRVAPEFFIRDFIQSAEKSYKLANLSAIDRYRKVTSKSGKTEVDKMKELYGVD